jgi:hypothetical protein
MTRRIHSHAARLLALPLSLVLPALASAQAGPKPSEIAAFLGTWALDMTNPAGARETVRVWDENGVARASVQSGRFPAINANNLLKDGDALILTATRFENGRPIRAVVALTLEGDTMKMAQMLEFSETIKRGSGKRAEENR